MNDLRPWLIEQQNDICETTEGVRSYTGYVHLPPGALNDTGDSHQNFPINSFFWFFEARKDPQNAPLAIWLNGGPGSSSMTGLFAENGPCHVKSDSNSTYSNEWSWNNEVNMLYLDQPVQVGFSYDILQNVTKNLAENDITVLENNGTVVPEQNNTLIVGTYPSQNSNHTAHGVRDAAKAAWHFMQTFTQEFPEYHPNNSRISVTTESFVSLRRTIIRLALSLTPSAREVAGDLSSRPTSRSKITKLRIALSSATAPTQRL